MRLVVVGEPAPPAPGAHDPATCRTPPDSGYAARLEEALVREAERLVAQESALQDVLADVRIHNTLDAVLAAIETALASLASEAVVLAREQGVPLLRVLARIALEAALERALRKR